VLSPGEGANLEVHIEEEPMLPRASFRRLYPLSDPSHYIAIHDEEKKEVGILRDLGAMDVASRELLEKELDRRYFTPSIQRINELRVEGGMVHFVVDTNRGSCEFYVRNWRDSAHEIGAGRWLIHSVDGQRFDIPKVDALDARSQNLLDQLL
jgi:hypothetical protein